jgi:putative ABC transport system ATP-binding protein
VSNPGESDAPRLPPALRTQDLHKIFGEGDAAVHAINGITLEFAAQTFSAVMGPSGSGKSTLLHCMAGLDSVTSGSVFIGDVELSELSDQERTIMRRDRVGFVFQGFNLLPTLSAIENITLPVSLAGRRPDPEWVDHLTGTLGLKDRLGHRPAQLSGGQQQRVAVARALINRPTIVFADEPTGNLDRRIGHELLALLQEAVRRDGQSIVMVTHDPVAASFADRVVFLVDGRIVAEDVDPSTDSVTATLTRLER